MPTLHDLAGSTLAAAPSLHRMLSGPPRSLLHLHSGVTFLRVDSAIPFDVTSPSVCAAGSEALAKSLRSKLCEAMLLKEDVEGTARSKQAGGRAHK